MAAGRLLSIMASLLGYEPMTFHFFGKLVFHFSWKLVD